VRDNQSIGGHLVIFLGVAAILIVVPGPDMALVTKNAILHGRQAALATSFGVNAGLTVWTVASAFGVASLVRTSSIAFTALKLAGAGYLIWLGVATLRSARRSPADAERAPDPRAKIGPRAGFRQGLLCNLGNPKIAAFFTGLLPQFIGSGRSVLLPFLLLGGVFVLMTFVWLCVYSLLVVRASALLRRPRVKVALDRLAGVILIGVGVRLATEHR
jgi:threonine/homoserine/homoserine lactone efflux protein